jgi:hypothetical protein
VRTFVTTAANVFSEPNLPKFFNAANVRNENVSLLRVPNFSERVIVDFHHMARFGKRAARDVCDILLIRRHPLCLEPIAFGGEVSIGLGMARDVASVLAK